MTWNDIRMAYDDFTDTIWCPILIMIVIGLVITVIFVIGNTWYNSYEADMWMYNDIQTRSKNKDFANSPEGKQCGEIIESNLKKNGKITRSQYYSLDDLHEKYNKRIKSQELTSQKKEILDTVGR